MPTGNSASTPGSPPVPRHRLLPPPPASARPWAHVQHYRRAGTVTRRGRRAGAQTLVRRRAPPAPNCIIEHLINVYCNIEARQHARNCPTGATASIVSVHRKCKTQLRTQPVSHSLSRVDTRLLACSLVGTQLFAHLPICTLLSYLILVFTHPIF